MEGTGPENEREVSTVKHFKSKFLLSTWRKYFWDSTITGGGEGKNDMLNWGSCRNRMTPPPSSFNNSAPTSHGDKDFTCFFSFLNLLKNAHEE